MAIETKYCNKCATEKSVEMFGTCSRNSSGLQSWCKECKSFAEKQNKPVLENGTMRVMYKPSLLKRIEEFCCTTCNRVKPLNEFYIKKGGYSASKCKSCITSDIKLKYNTDENYRLKVRESQKNNPIRSEYNTKYHRDRYNSDPIFRLTKNVRTRMTQFISSGKKLGSTVELLGCSGEDLKRHLENNFKSGMTWENYGSVWEMDHVKPIASFDLTKKEEQHKCFSYTNIQPLFTTTKIAKNNGHMNEIGNRNKQSKLI